MNDLSESWSTTALGSVTTIRTGKLDANAADADGLYPFFTCAEQTLTIKRYAFDTEAVLLAGNGGFCVKWYTGKFNAYQRTYVIEPRGIHGRYLFYAIQHAIPEITKSDRGSTIKYLRLGDITEAEIPLPPLAEQKRIADKLDALLARVDACRARLARVPGILKRFRQAVLAAAVEGRLTEDWRGENGAQYPWETVVMPDVAQSRLGKMLDKAKNQGKLTPYLRNINVRWFDFDLTDIQEIRISPKEAESLFIRQGDVLICEGGEPGRCAVWNGPSDTYVFQKALHRVQVGESLIAEWLCYSLKAEADAGRLENLFTGTTIKHLTGVALARFEFGLPTKAEQHEIVRRVELLFAYADRLAARHAAALAQVEQLTPSLLAKAFRGELVAWEATTGGERGG
jgi:type I restriction enzyme, S subunit